MCRDLPLDGGLEAFFCDMAQGAPAAAVTSVEFASRIGDPSAASASQRREIACSGFVNDTTRHQELRRSNTAIS
jgi:hypothetical protein